MSMKVAPRYQPYLIAAIACTGLVSLTVHDVVVDRERSVTNAKANTANLAVLLEEHVRQTLGRAEGELEDAASRREPKAQTSIELPADGFIRALTWVDAGGRIVREITVPGTPLHTPAECAETVSMAQRADAGRRALGRPQKDAAWAWTLPMARQVPLADQSAPGTLIAWIDLHPMQQSLNAIDRGSNGFITLFRPDGWILATAPAHDGVMSRQWDKTPLFQEHLPRARRGSVQQMVVRDRTERVYSYRAMDDFPVVVSVGISMSDALSEWQSRVWFRISLVLGMVVALFVGAGILSRTLARREAAEARMAEVAADAARSERFLRALTDSLPIRIAHFDLQQRFRFANRMTCERFDRGRDEVIGRTREELTGEPMPQPLAEHLALALQGQPQRFEFDELIGSARRRMDAQLIPELDADGRVRGCYVTGTDVTEARDQQQRIEKALAERETLLREVYHRVKNNLQVIQSLMNLQLRTLPPGAARFALEESARRVHAMALVHERMYGEGDLSAIDLRDYTRQLLGDLAESAGAAARGIELDSAVDELSASLVASVPYGLLVTELVGNSLKHGFPEGRQGRITVSLHRHGTGTRLTVSDSGVGLPEGFSLEGSSSMGLQLAASLAGQLGGTLRAASLSGAVFSVELTQIF